MNSSARRAAIKLAQLEMQWKPVFLDTETTGLDATDQIVEICILSHGGRRRVDTLVKPKGKIPAVATAIHGITDAMVKDAPTWPEIWPEVEAALAGQHVAIYNADFDVRLMRQTHRKHGLRWALPGTEFVCVMKLYAQYYGAWNAYHGAYRWQKLEDAVTQCRLEAPGAHRARADALMARAVLKHLAEWKS